MTAITEILINVQNKGLLANRPAAAINGRNYWATDNLTMYQDNGITWETLFTIPSNTAVTVEEVDGTPTGTATKIVFPNGTLSFAGSVATYTPSGGSVTVQEQDGTPSAIASTLKFPNGSVTNEGGGVLSIRDVPVGFIGVETATSTTALSAGSYVTLAFSGADAFDTDGFHDPVINNTRLTVPAGLGGKYLLIVRAGWPASHTDRRVAYRINGGADIGFNRLYYGDGGASTSMTEMLVVSLNGGDYIEIRQFSDVAGAAATYAQLVKLDAGRVGSGIGAKAYASTSQNIASGGTVPLDTELFDTDNFHSASNTSRMTVPAGLGGKYFVSAMLQDQSGGNTPLILKNGAPINGIGTVVNQFIAANIQGVVELAAGDYVELQANNTGGGTHQIYGAAGSWQTASLSIMRLDSHPTSNAAAYNYTEQNTTFTLASSGAIVSSTPTLRAGVYAVQASIRTTEMTASGNPGTAQLRRNGVVFGTQIDLRPTAQNVFTLFGVVVHDGSAVTWDAYFSHEAGTTRFGINGSSEARFGQKLMIHRIGD